MGEFLKNYEPVNPTTWVYLASLLLIALYFKFSRLWSVRNLDLIGLMAFSPGLLMVNFGSQEANVTKELAGYIWLFAVGGLFMVRLLLDSVMVRRPLLEPNLSAGGLTFLGVTLFIFLMTNVLVINRNLLDRPPAEKTNGGDVAGPVVADNGEIGPAEFANYGPGNPLFFHYCAGFWTHPPVKTTVLKTVVEPSSTNGPTTNGPTKNGNETENGGANKDIAKVEPLPADVHPPAEIAAKEPTLLPYDAQNRAIAVASHILIVLGLVIIGQWHFDNLRTGIAAAGLYLLLPYTAQWTGQVTHVLPGALLLWAIVTYRRPFLAGLFLGLAIATVYYPIFLLPLWISFYFQRGWRRLMLGVLSGAGILVASMWCQAASSEQFLGWVKQTFGLRLPASKNLEGFWGLQYIDPVYRIPVLAAFLVVAFSFVLWPSRKNLGTLLSCSAVVMLATQFWHAHRGGVHMAWYLPLMLLTIFRPNLEDRVATTVLGEGWFSRRKPLQPAPTTPQT